MKVQRYERLCAVLVQVVESEEQTVQVKSRMNFFLDGELRLQTALAQKPMQLNLKRDSKSWH